MIYVVEDDPGIRELECYALRQAGFEARGFEEGQSFLEAVRVQLPQLVLLDVMLPGEAVSYTHLTLPTNSLV